MKQKLEIEVKVPIDCKAIWNGERVLFVIEDYS